MRLIIFLLMFKMVVADSYVFPISKTEFVVNSKSGKYIKDMRGKNFIVLSLREIGADGRFYAVDSDGTMWRTGVISSGARKWRTPEGAFKVNWKKRYHMSTKYPDESGINNMDYSMFFNGGIAIHQGNPNYMSHGCIHVAPQDASTLFKWGNHGLNVIVTRQSYINYVRRDIEMIYGR